MNMEMSPLSVKGCKMLAYVRSLRPLSRDGSLLWALVFPVSYEGSPHLITSYDTQGDAEDLFLPGSLQVHLALSDSDIYTSQGLDRP
jgi:hypothetical protein